MRRTLHLSSTAETFDRGVLASRLASLVAQPRGHAISETDRSDVTAAIALVSELLSGMKGLSNKNSINDASARGIKSLGLALTPLEELRNSAERCNRGPLGNQTSPVPAPQQIRGPQKESRVNCNRDVLRVPSRYSSLFIKSRPSKSRTTRPPVKHASG